MIGISTSNNAGIYKIYVITGGITILDIYQFSIDDVNSVF